jgi:amino acid transporter
VADRPERSIASGAGEASPETRPLVDVRDRAAGDPLRRAGGIVGGVKRLLIGKPRDPNDPSVFHKISLMAFLAWVGLGADGLSSSSYGPDEAFRAIQGHEYLALYLALMTAVTVGVISFAYSLLIEHFPTGGGGYVVATKLLGPRAGVVSGSALVVDYVLTITVSIASGVDAIFSFLPLPWQGHKLAAAFVILAALMVLNLRGVKESIKVLLPIFLVFLATHLLLIVYGVLAHAGGLPEIFHQSHARAAGDARALGIWPLLFVLLRAYSLGGGTYTGIEAVSNGLQILREPKVATGKRTMLYMACSLAFTAGGILVCYLLWHAVPVEGKTMNAALLDRVFGSWVLGPWPVGAWIVVVTLVSEGALLIVAAQTGFIDGPRVLSNMALDTWVPRRFASLSERLVAKNGIFVMGVSAGALLLYTRGNVSFLVVLYAINVFLTFSLTEMGMSRFWVTEGRKHNRRWLRNLMVHLTGLTLCLAILVVTTMEKFKEGGWLTLVVTTSFVLLCFAIQRHYTGIRREIRKLDEVLLGLPTDPPAGPPAPLDPGRPIAALLVSGYSGLGVHSLLSAQRLFPGTFRDVMFLSVGAVDSGHFKGREAIEALRLDTEGHLRRYVDLARGLGLNADYRLSIGTEVLEEAVSLCRGVAEAYPRATFFLGKLIFERETLVHRALHNDTAFAIQRRLQFAGVPTVLLPVRVRSV